MHILLAILGGVAALVFYLAMISRNAPDAVDSARTLANLPRRLRWQARQRKLSVRALEDPREAAVVALITVARSSGDMSSAQKDQILDFATREFSLSRSDAQDMMTLCLFMLRDTLDPMAEMRHILQPLQAQVAPDERSRLIDAAVAVANADGGEPGDATMALVERLEDGLIGEAAARPA